MYSTKEALIDEQDTIQRAIARDDDETLYSIARNLKARGEDEYAEEVLALAKRADKNNWAYDVSINN